MLELRLVHLDGHLGAHGVLQTSSMVKMKVAHNDRLNVLYIMTYLRDLRVEL